jgi:hypothetical protein
MVFKSRAIAKDVSCRPFTTETRVRSRTSPCESYDWQSGSGTRVSSSTFHFSCHYHSVIATYLHIHVALNQKEKRAKPDNLLHKHCSFRCRGF